MEGEDVLEEDGPEEVDYADDDEELYHVDMDFAVTALCAEDDESPPSPTSPDAFDEDPVVKKEMHQKQMENIEAMLCL